MTRIVHLVDDTTAGGVMRVLDHIQTCPQMNLLGQHRIVEVGRDRAPALSLEADVIVSHLSISWRRLTWFMNLRAANAGLPLIHVEHSYTEAFTGQNVANRLRFRALLTTAYALFDRVVAVSEAQGVWLRTRGFVRPEALSVIPSAVDVSAFLALEPLRQQPRVIAAIGRLEPQKGFDILISALRASTDRSLTLAIYGDGSERARLEALAAGDARIVFHDWADPVEIMAQVDAVAMPSRWEAYGLVALEARAAGRPVLAGRVDGLRDHVEDGALAVEGQGVAAWTAAMEALRTHHPEMTIARARKAAAAAPARFASEWGALLASVGMQPEVAQAA